MTTLRFALLLSGCGLAGVWLRYGMGLGLQRLLGPGFGWGTLAVNVVGCFLLGYLVQLPALAESRELRTALAIGLLGGFTTFSAFGYETVTFLQAGNWRLALLNILLNVVLGIAAVLLGMAAAR
jgi:fluoride exporter